MMNPIPVALQSFFRNVGKELSYLANTGDEVNAIFSESNRLTSSGVQPMDGILFLVYRIYN